MNETIITVSGNLVSDVDFKVTGRGDALARFRLASTVTRYDRASGRWLDGDTAYWNVTAWRRAAENARASLARGMPVVLQAKVRQRTVDREVPGSSGTTMPVTFTDLEAVHFGLDLSRCRAVFQRAPIGPQTDAAGQPGGEGAGSGGAVSAGAAATGPDAAGEVPPGVPAAPDGAAA
jgi:single-strand DNA-binding protein